MTTITVTSGQSPANQTVNNGDTLDVLSGGTIVTASVLSGGSAIIEVGGIDSGSTIAAGGSELVYGSANADLVSGLQTVSTGAANGIVTNETVANGGVVFLSIKNTSASNTTIDAGGALNINGSISATNTTLSGGTVSLQSAKATLTGSLVFAGGGTLDVTGNSAAGSGDLAVISGFATGDVIDMTAATTIGAATGDTITSAVSAGNTVITVSGGGVSDTYLFSGTTIGAGLVLATDGAGGREIILPAVASGSTSVGSGVTSSNVAVPNGGTLTVNNGGTIVAATVASGGLATILAGGVDSAAIISGGGSETVAGSATGDSIFGSQTVSGVTGTASGDTVQGGGSVTATGTGATVSGADVLAGGVLNLGDNTSAVNTTIAGGTVNLLTANASVTGTLAFNGPGTLDVASPSNAGFGDQAVISGFYYGDVVGLPGLGAGATLSTTSAGGNTVATVTSGSTSETLTFSGSVAASLGLIANGGTEQIGYVPPPTTTSYTPGDLVLSIYGNGAGTGMVTLDQAAPITLEEITTAGAIVSEQMLTQTTTVVNGVTEYAVSGEYQSASEGLLTLAGNGQSLTILGYGVNAAAFDAANGATVYGTSALGQSTSLLGGPFTAVPRVVADISYNGSIDTSTSLTGIFNTNNPRSVITVDGTQFYLSGQGNGADGTEGVFLAADGSSGATAVFNTRTDTRDIAIYNGQLYVSVDSKQNGGANIYNFGTILPTGAVTPTALPGIGPSLTLTAGQANSVNASAVGTSINLSPEQYFFANATTLYVADGGVPKEGGLGDGGLQKWSLVNNSWVLDYTLSQGLNMVANTSGSGTSGLVGLTGTVEGGNVVFYASNETVAETDPTFLYGITDALAATTAPTNESFTLLETAAPGTLIRGVAFAPSAVSTTPQVSTTLTVSTGVTSAGLSVTNGGSLIVQGGGTITGTTLLSAGQATISSNAVDSATFVAHGATELVLGSASFDIIDGVQTVSNGSATVNNEIVENGGSLDLFLKGAIASATNVNAGGQLNISGNAFATSTVISGGAVVLESPKAVLNGTLTFVGNGGTIEETAVVSAGYGDLATVSGFGATDVIDFRAISAGASLATTVSGTSVSATVISGGVTETFSFAGSSTITGSSYASGLALVADGAGGVELTYTPPPPVIINVASGVTSSGLSLGSGSTINVLSGGTMSAITLIAGGSAVIAAGGVDSGSTVLAGGYETVSGSADGDQVFGIQNVTSGPNGGALPATVSNETVFNGGTIELFLKPDVGTNITVSSGGSLLLSGNVSATNTTLEGGAFMALQSPKATLTGALTFSGGATVAVSSVTSGGFGDLAVISGWQAGDVIDETLISATVATLTTTTSGGNTVETISGGPIPQSFTFAGTAIGSNIALVSDGISGVELAYVACFATGTMIQTESGECAVEKLGVGDRVQTASGATRPIVWIGRRTLDLRRHPHPLDVMPVRVVANAVAPGCPVRDLVLSPEHALFLDGVLIPVRHLVNGATVLQESAERVTWWHVELDAHDVILAEAMPTESYLDTGNRGAFVNAGPGYAIHAQPDFTRGSLPAQPCAPLVTAGPALVRTQEMLQARSLELALAEVMANTEAA